MNSFAKRFTSTLLVLLLGLSGMAWGQIISQYIETNSGSYPKGIEIWNNTESTLDFSSNTLSIEQGTNGGAPSEVFSLTSGTLAAGDVIVIGTTGAPSLQTVTEGNGATFYYEPFTFNGNDALVVKYNGTITDVFGDPGTGDPGTGWAGNGVQTYNQNIQIKTGINTGDTDGWTDPSIRFETVSTDPVNDLTGFGIAPVGAGALPPSISNIVSDPSANITSSTTVSVSADVTAGDAALNYVELHWNTTNDFGTYTTISMSVDAGDTYITDTDITAQSNGTTVYYRVYAEDVDTESSTSAVQSYTVTDPATTTLPYAETFVSDLGDCYTYSVSGATKEWGWSQGSAYINGYNSGDIEEDWLIFPGINLDNYSDEIMIFNAWYNYGADDADNYLKLMYSTDYNGLGDPTSANWTELSYTQPSESETWTSSGNVDLSAISGTSVWIAFKYRYESGSYRSWSIDNISIYTLAPEPSNHAGSFSATADDHQSITLTWSDNDGAQAAHGYLVGFTTDSENSFTPVDGTPVANADGPPDWVRNVAHGVGTVTISGLSAETQYYAKIWPYTNAGDNIDYKTDETVPVCSTSTDAAPPLFVINEILADPDGTTGDANGDGIVDTGDDEFIEIINRNGNTVDISGWQIYDAVGLKHTIPEGTIINNNVALVVFGGGTPTGIPGIVQVASAGYLQLNNTGDDVILKNITGVTIATYTYGGEGGDNQSIARNPDFTGDFVKHTTITENPVSFSPGKMNTQSDTPLPITLASFSASALNGTVSVSWITESETENAAFRIYRDGEMLAELEGAGTTTEPRSYSWTDNYVVPGKTYTYQLADVDYQGKETKHPEVEVKVEVELDGKDFVIGAAYPNPFNPVTVVPVNLAKDATVRAQLYDISGRPLQELHNGTLAAGSHALTINGANLSTGIYFVRININDNLHVQKIALMK